MLDLKIQKQSCKTKFHHHVLFYFVMQKYRHLLDSLNPINDGIRWHNSQNFISMK